MRAHMHQQSCDNQEGRLLIPPQDSSNQQKETSAYPKQFNQSKKRGPDGNKKPDAGKYKKPSKSASPSQQRNKIDPGKGSKKKQSLITKVYASSRPKQTNTIKQENKKNRPQQKSHNMNRYIDNKFNKFLMIGITLSFIIFVLIIMFVDLNKNSHPYSSFKIRLKKGINGSKSVYGFTVKQLGFDKYVQVGTQLNFLNLQLQRQYRRFVKEYDKHFPYRVYSGDNLQLDNESDINSMNLNLKLDTNTKILNKPENVQQIDICIFTYLQSASNQKLLNKIYNNYFTSIGQQSYTNYKIILIDDNSKDNIYKKIYPLYSNNSVLMERITIIRNQKQLGKIGSFYLHKKQCLSSQVVMYIDAYDSLNGHQAFKIISQTYKNPDVWMAYSKSYLQMETKNDSQNKNVIQLNAQQKEKPTLIQSQSYRLIPSDQQISGLVSHRVELLTRLPIEHFIQYEYNFNDLSLKPVFYNCTKNKFLIYLLIQLCTSKHIKLINHNLYLQGRQILKREKCSAQKQSVCAMKVRIKKQINGLASLSDNKPLKNDQNPKSSLQQHKIVKQYVDKIQKLSICTKQKIENPQKR